MDFYNCRDTDSDLDCFEVDSIVEEVEAIEGDDTASTKDLLKKMIELIIKQHDEIKLLKQHQRKLQDMVVLNTNAIQIRRTDCGSRKTIAEIMPHIPQH